MNHEKTLPSISAEAVAQELECLPEHLEYWAWPQVFGSTAGPFGVVAGQGMTPLTLEAWHDGGGMAIIFCQGRRLKFTREFRLGFRL